MHGHPFEDPTQLWWGTGVNEAAHRNLGRAIDARPSASEMFRAGGDNGVIDDGGNIRNVGELHKLMQALSERILNEDPPAPSSTNLPSGYTYLLQFIAHDVVDTVVSVDVKADAIIPTVANARSRWLQLETLYGSGPEECPHAYQFELPAMRLIPRTLLRIGPFQDGSDEDKFATRRDIARAKSNSDAEHNPHFWEGLVADPRSDAHALMSQLTILFQLLHRSVARIVAQHTPSSEEEPLPRRELAIKRFACARHIVSLIYRRIVFNDVLQRILDPDIYRRYTNPEGNLPLDNGASIPLEFTFGAFRFGHAMVREQYHVNTEFPSQPINRALTLSGAQVDKSWFVDWARFFETGAHDPNRSMPIGPHVSPTLRSSIFDSKVVEFDAAGLPHRDLISGCSAGLLSVPTLCRELGARFPEVKAFAEWREPMQQWLIAKRPFSEHSAAEKLESILNDPPLSFFVLFEAENAQRGERLGPLGSIIVAETLFYPLLRDPLPFEDQHQPFGDQAKHFSEVIFRPPQFEVGNALAHLPDIKSMPDLLNFLKSNNVFATG